MQLQTIIKTPKYEGLFSHKTHILSLGSCFADTISEKLKNDMFQVCANPFGVLFNPESIAQNLERIESKEYFTKKDFRYSNDKYFSFSLHSSFSSSNLEEAIKNANNSLEDANNTLNKMNIVILTFGTAFAYTLKENNTVVANCHRESQDLFIRNSLSINEIVKRYKTLLSRLWEKHNFKVLFTVSPIRHLRDGIHENQISKSILHLAIEELVNWNKEKCLYYPSYEIMIDELRDYRFYADDMAHPSPLAVDYIYERLVEDTMTKQTKECLKQIRAYQKLLHHRVKDETKAKEFNKQLNQMYDNIISIITK